MSCLPTHRDSLTVASVLAALASSMLHVLGDGHTYCAQLWETTILWIKGDAIGSTAYMGNLSSVFLRRNKRPRKEGGNSLENLFPVHASGINSIHEIANALVHIPT